MRKKSKMEKEKEKQIFFLLFYIGYHHFIQSNYLMFLPAIYMCFEPALCDISPFDLSK